MAESQPTGRPSLWSDERIEMMAEAILLLADEVSRTGGLPRRLIEIVARLKELS